MLKLCILGLGNAGNQVADLAKKLKDIPGLAINSSEKDLINVCNIDKMVIGDEKGAGKDRNEAKNFTMENIQDLFNQPVFNTLIKDNEVITIISSTGGGTGSGMAPVLTDILSRKYKNKRFLLVQIYPSIKESIAAQQNTIEYLKEIKEFLPNVTYMAYDNNKRSMKTTKEMMEEINTQIVEDLCILRGDYQFPTPYTSIDEKDSLKLIETPNRIAIVNVSNLKEKDLDDKSIEDMLINEIKNNAPIVELERDRIVKRLGIITNLSDKMQKCIDTNVPVVKEFIGEPVEDFSHIFVNKEETDLNRVIIILSGLSVPDDRIQKILQRIEEATKELSRVKESSILDKANVDAITNLRSTSNVPDEKPDEIIISDIFSKYMKKK
jgi:hypothetical protein